MSTPSKKRRVIPLQDKKRIIARVDEKKSYAEIGTEFGGLSKSTISTILKERKAVLSANEEGRNAKRARMKTAAHDDLEESVLQWLKDARSENIPVNGPLLTRYMETHDVDPAMLRKCDELDEFLAKERIKKMKQNQITNYFCPAD
uniref:HTH psq-type domain-containing protein n=1 Tax=Ditylenchus dipsaci TaxID=166011 RepID=A0A915D173_9BILA